MVGQRGLLQDSQEDRYHVSPRRITSLFFEFSLTRLGQTTLRSDLSARLNLSAEEGEKWIVNLIRDSKMGIDAKIDLQAVSWPISHCTSDILLTSPFHSRRTCSTSRDLTLPRRKP